MTSVILLDSADEIARWLGVQAKTVRMWARRGHITRHPGDRYDALEVADWWDRERDARMDEVRRGVAKLTESV